MWSSSATRVSSTPGRPPRKCVMLLSRELSMFAPRVLIGLAVFSATSFAQSVVSARSGVIHFSEGSVFLDGQPVEQKFGRFAEMKAGSELRTDWGHAEVLLTPGMFLRIGDNTA